VSTRELVFNFEVVFECTGSLCTHPSRVAAGKHGLFSRLLLDARQPPAHPAAEVDVGLEGQQLLVVPGTRQCRACPMNVSAQVSRGTHPLTSLYMDGGSFYGRLAVISIDIGQA
jgi:hypothetical protein